MLKVDRMSYIRKEGAKLFKIESIKKRSYILTLAISVIVFALSINFRWSILTFRNLGKK